MFIYKITNKVNQKIYVGQTTSTDPLLRWKNHLRFADNRPKLRIQFAIRKYGKDNFTFEVIDTATTLEELNAKEAYWVEKLKCIENRYNLKPGGQVNPMHINSIKLHHDDVMRSDAVRKKEALATHLRMQRGIPESTRRKLSIASKGNKRNLGKKRKPSAILLTVKKTCKHVSCITLLGESHQFTSVKEAANWWYSNGYPIGKVSLMGYIKKSATNETYIHGVKWTYGECVETIEKVSES